MNYVTLTNNQVQVAIKEITAKMNREFFGYWINEFKYTFSKRYKKSYLYYESQYSRIKIAEYR